MVGYITASIKNVSDTRVGDTVTDNERPCAEPLPGYKKVQSDGILWTVSGRWCQVCVIFVMRWRSFSSMMHHCSLSRRHPLHSALVSAVDFLGLLHLEIIQERLEREYNLDLVTTAPGVIYKVHKTNGDVIELTNPSNLAGSV